MEYGRETDGRGVWQRGTAARFSMGRWELAFSHALRREAHGRAEYALPYSPAQPWPLPELFCFARVQTIGGQEYIIYAFDEKKAPIF